jgi:hypothetical protein
VKTCETCRWWKAHLPTPYPSYPKEGRCSLLSEDEAKGIEFEADYAASFDAYTNKDFGCTEHEEKTEDGK